MSEGTTTGGTPSIIYVITLVVTIIGMVAGAYWNVMQTVSAQATAIESVRAREDLMEKQNAAQLERDDRFSAEMRAALSQINQGVADLRVLEAQRAPKK